MERAKRGLGEAFLELGIPQLIPSFQEARPPNFDKIVKLACKPKAAPPKAKYMDPIIAATWSDDGAVSDVCKALVPRLREPNHVVVFKALIVLHMMIRNGPTDTVLSYLSHADILRLKNVSVAHWEGFTAPENLQHYAMYLDSRIRAYGQLKHDAIRVQTDTSRRDMRNLVSVDEQLVRKKKPRSQDDPASIQRDKTLAGRKLRSMTVEQGLLREIKIIHGMIDALVECRFYLDDLEDELNVGALRMLVKDLLILFQAGNEGVINVLEYYFEMSHADAEEALKIYSHFCNQIEKVVDFWGVSKKLQHLLNITIPNLKHAPVSLAGAMQEHLEDPNFEDNRLEYKANKKTSDKATKRPAGNEGEETSSVTFSDTSGPSSLTAEAASSSSASATNGQKDATHCLASTKSEQTPTSCFIPQQPFKDEDRPPVSESDNRRLKEFFYGGNRNEVGIRRHRRDSVPKMELEMEHNITEAATPLAAEEVGLQATGVEEQRLREFFYGEAGGQGDIRRRGYKSSPVRGLETEELDLEGLEFLDDPNTVQVNANVDVDANRNATNIFGNATCLAVSSGGVLNVAGRDINHHHQSVLQEHQHVALYYQQYDLPPLKHLQDEKKERSGTRYRRRTRCCASCNLQ